MLKKASTDKLKKEFKLKITEEDNFYRVIIRPKKDFGKEIKPIKNI